MISKGLISITFLAAGFLIACAPALGQVTQQELDEQIREDQERLQAALLENIQQKQSAEPEYIARFLGYDPNSWAVSLLSVGGIFGTQTLASVNSQGKLFCRIDGDKIVTEDIEPTELAEISRLLNDARKRKRLTFKPSRKDIACSDCAAYAVVINERKGGEITDLTLGLAVHGPDVAALYDMVRGLKACTVD